MTTDNQKEQLKGYVQAVQELSAVIKRINKLQSAPVRFALADLESEMRGKVLRLVEGQE